MILPINKRFYKVISLLAKAVILIFSLGYIFFKLYDSIYVIDYSNLILKYLIIVCMLMPLNWGIEAVKWQILISPLEKLSFERALKSIFAGVTVSIFTPNRIGEFAGRIFFLQKADKIHATLKMFIGSISQLFVTIVAGVIAMLLYYQKGLDVLHPIALFNQQIVRGSLIIMAFVLIVAILLYRKKKLFSEKIQPYISSLFEIKANTLFKIILLSIFRYSVFAFQYYLVLLLFNIPIDIQTAFILIALTFFVTSAIPTFAFTEIVVRGAASVYFFSIVTNNNTSIIAASLMLWIINLALPALIGSLFVLNLKLVND
jgi:uncharacterized membrane protein YbhN (UPF0104 family)